MRKEFLTNQDRVHIPCRHLRVVNHDKSLFLSPMICFMFIFRQEKKAMNINHFDSIQKNRLNYLLDQTSRFSLMKVKRNL